MLKTCAIPSLNPPKLHSYQSTLSLRGVQLGRYLVASWGHHGYYHFRAAGYFQKTTFTVAEFIFDFCLRFDSCSFLSIISLIYQGCQRAKHHSILVLIYMNDQRKCIKYSKTYHFADDTSITQSHSLPQILSKRINKDLSNLSNWLKTNKLSLNIQIVIINP